MSMTISIDNLRKALRDTNAKAAAAFADAEKLKDGMIAACVDPTEGEHFEKVDTAYKGYSVLADEAAQIEALREVQAFGGNLEVFEAAPGIEARRVQVGVAEDVG